MSREAAMQFRDAIALDEELQRWVVASLEQDRDISALVAKGAERGYAFTEEEAADTIDSLFGENADGELNDFELEVISGGKGSSQDRGDGRDSDPNQPREDDQASAPEEVTSSFLRSGSSRSRSRSVFRRRVRIRW